MKRTAVPAFSETNPIQIEDAYKELTPSAFAVWMRMMMLDDKTLSKGRGYLARALGYGEARCNEILRELKNKAYIRIFGDCGKPSTVEILRPAMIANRNRFVKLANVFLPDVDSIAPTSTHHVQSSNRVKFGCLNFDSLNFKKNYDENHFSENSLFTVFSFYKDGFENQFKSINVYLNSNSNDEVHRFENTQFLHKSRIGVSTFFDKFKESAIKATNENSQIPHFLHKKRGFDWLLGFSPIGPYTADINNWPCDSILQHNLTKNANHPYNFISNCDTVGKSAGVSITTFTTPFQKIRDFYPTLDGLSSSTIKSSSNNTGTKLNNVLTISTNNDHVQTSHLISEIDVKMCTKRRIPEPDESFLDELRGRKSTEAGKKTEQQKTYKKVGKEEDERLSIQVKKDFDPSYIKSFSSKSNSLNLKKFKNLKKQKEENKKTSKRTGKANRQDGLAREQKLDWTKIDAKGFPAFNWDMKGEERTKVIKLLSRPERDWEKRQLILKLTSEFKRYYTRYRIAILKARGCNDTHYMFGDHELKYARQAAIMCIAKNVTPRQLLEYWHVNIKDFAHRKMKIPPMVFLSSAANIDTVSCAVIESDSGHKWRPGDFTRSGVEVGHSFSDTSALHKDLRRTIERAGINTKDWSDRHLMSVQGAARDMAAGWEAFIDGDMKPLVLACVHLFEDEDKA